MVEYQELVEPFEEIFGIKNMCINYRFRFWLFLCFQLTNLERKWQHHEQNNFMVKECILFFKKYSKIHTLY